MARPRASDIRRYVRSGFVPRFQARLRTRIIRPLRRDGLDDLAHLLAAPSVRTVVDVGANLGNLSASYLHAFPAARVIAIEADSRSTAALRRRFGDESRFELIEAAASDRPGEEATFFVTPNHATSSLLIPLDGAARAGTEEVTVPTVTIDDLCDQRSITSIDLLKVDVEGAEIEVLRGADRLLRASAIRAVYAEARFIRETEGGVVLHELAAFLSDYGYRLHNLYDLVESQARGIIYANAVFLGPAEADALAARTNDRIFVQRLGRPEPSAGR